ncbi:Glutamine-dependent NAD(+) synthetase [bioreactor metagenome]|uniref:Glutamine-dependent NAD(+) synthetase n=1 Tax=bioreactor metagenome TaxID=1076179 RepID=A0A644Z424_9ZZZZ
MLLDCALFISNGKLLGVVPKNIKTRWFNTATAKTFIYDNYEVAISDKLIFASMCKIGICVGAMNNEKLSTLNNAELIINIDAQPYYHNYFEDTINELASLSKFSNQAIVYANTNPCESTTDYVYTSLLAVFECGKQVLNKNYKHQNSFSFDTNCYSAEIDIDIVRAIRKKKSIENKMIDLAVSQNQIINFELPTKKINTINRFTTNHLHSKHNDFSNRQNTCNKESSNEHNENELKSFYIDPFLTHKIKYSSQAIDIVTVQALGLAKRLRHINSNNVVIGISGGIDSTLALLVCDKCFDILGYPKNNINAVFMPCFGTSAESARIAKQLAEALTVNYIEIPITDAVTQHFKDISHNAEVRNLVYENSQARQRTMILFNYANKTNGIVVGTGNMSEIALGWSTYNADHISNYNVNCGIPKTVAKAILEFYIYSKANPKIDGNLIARILERPISPELLPADENNEIQSTEQIIGQYELHDFFLFYHLSYFLSKEKLLYIAKYSFSNKYSVEEIENTLDIFLHRFHQSQYKRSCSTDGPSIFSVSLSPRTGFVLPSDI